MPLVAPLGSNEWQALFDASRCAAVTALLYDAILMLPPHLRPPREVLFHFAAVARTVEDDNRRREAALCHFADFLNVHLALPAVVVKGSSLARHYPVPFHRECGDNDLYTGADTNNIAHQVATLGISVARHNPRHISFCFEQTEFECHDHLLYHAVEEPQWHSVPFADAGSGLCRLPMGQEAFFLAKHMEYHAVFFHTSVRLRDLVDWTLMLRSPEFDYTALCSLKAGTDVDRFADLLTHYCVHLFNQPAPASLPPLPNRISAADFERLFMRCPERHPSPLVRVARRSWHYLRHRRTYRLLYGQGMFRRFYWRNLIQCTIR